MKKAIILSVAVSILFLLCSCNIDEKSAPESTVSSEQSIVSQSSSENSMSFASSSQVDWDVFLEQYAWVDEWNENGILRVRTSAGSSAGKYGYLDKTGKYVIPADYHYISRFQEGLAFAGINGEYGYFDESGKIIIPFQYEDASMFTNGLAVVKKDGKWGYIDNTGEFIIEPEYAYATSFLNNELTVAYTFYYEGQHTAEFFDYHSVFCSYVVINRKGEKLYQSDDIFRIEFKLSDIIIENIIVSGYTYEAQREAYYGIIDTYLMNFFLKNNQYVVYDVSSATRIVGDFGDGKQSEGFNWTPELPYTLLP